MQFPVAATFKQSQRSDMSEPIKCALVFHPTRAQKHRHELLRYLVLLVAFVAVVLLLAIALYYTQGNAIHVQHVSYNQPPFGYRISLI